MSDNWKEQSEIEREKGLLRERQFRVNLNDQRDTQLVALVL